MEKAPENISPRYNRQELYEYHLVVSPDQPVFDKVMEEKQHFYRNYAPVKVSKSVPHITVSNFMAKDGMEDTLIRWMQRIVGNQKSFPVLLNNYSGFPPDTVFLRIQNPDPLRKLAMGLTIISPYIKGNSCPPAHFVTNPHVSIARKLPAAVYEKAIREYSLKSFTESFDVTELILLRRQHSHDKCKKVAVFPLRSNTD